MAVVVVDIMTQVVAVIVVMLVLKYAVYDDRNGGTGGSSGSGSGSGDFSSRGSSMIFRGTTTIISISPSPLRRRRCIGSPSP